MMRTLAGLAFCFVLIAPFTIIFGLSVLEFFGLLFAGLVWIAVLVVLLMYLIGSHGI